jgi:hypothetical protein
MPAKVTQDYFSYKMAKYDLPRAYFVLILFGKILFFHWWELIRLSSPRGIFWTF